MSFFDDHEEDIVGLNDVPIPTEKLFRNALISDVRREIKWTTKSGQKLHFDDMTNDHLRNIRALLLRRKAKHDDILQEVVEIILTERNQPFVQHHTAGFQ